MKLLSRDGSPVELYHVVDDPVEATDLPASRPEIAAGMVVQVQH